MWGASSGATCRLPRPPRAPGRQTQIASEFRALLLAQALATSTDASRTRGDVVAPHHCPRPGLGLRDSCQRDMATSECMAHAARARPLATGAHMFTSATRGPDTATASSLPLAACRGPGRARSAANAGLWRGHSQAPAAHKVPSPNVTLRSSRCHARLLRRHCAPRGCAQPV